MTLNGYNAFCSGLPATSSVVQWGGAHVWKVGAKVFAIARTDDGVALSVTFKCSWASFDILKEQPGLRPAPYLASRGMSWIQRLTDETMPDDALEDYLRESHRLVAAGLTKRARAELGLDVPTRSRSRQG
ncbi:MmcQ/YjbR family DNA-binding protein [Bosea sp. (in: a-proteobacteria)]|uniref:MmcQ/YjbR family DNA-binding protein n=1 Tax=Bosea sp. (in: a-proteobacteria) TaxID=1871050 RepID=UPI0027355CFE|nr:MmcQ/YjbR family DNA-binding protein [Bosea sp. (in: a-proteobacteria)]MDP3409713.1 MmcQ/YjbR family DNA-binding protein [Bosea sp. (in: a-proteobacteria)]